jgi:hypothetical protein
MNILLSAMSKIGCESLRLLERTLFFCFNNASCFFLLVEICAASFRCFIDHDVTNTIRRTALADVNFQSRMDCGSNILFFLFFALVKNNIFIYTFSCFFYFILKSKYTIR